MRKIFAALAVLLCACSWAFAAVPGTGSPEKAVQVTQPAYHNMKFYVYKPVNVPKDFYVTFDGYLVYKNAKGIWNYGSAEKGGITRTDFVVGAVIPSVVRLKPYTTRLSAVAPLLEVEAEKKPADTQTQTQAKSPRIVYMPPASGLELYTKQELSPNNPDWTQNSNFMALGKWQKSIDRIGVTYRPTFPVAWKGDFPEVIYAWTGLQWKQLDAKQPHTKALSTLKREIYDLQRFARKVGHLHWGDDDTNVLSQYSVMWGYQWMGLIFLGGDF